MKKDQIVDLKSAEIAAVAGGKVREGSTGVYGKVREGSTGVYG